MNASLLALQMVASTIYGEAGGEPAGGMEAVAEVIAVRMQERRLDAVSVCLQRRQFCVWNRGTAPVYRRIKVWEATDGPRWQDAKELANRVIHGVYPIGPRRFNHFYNPRNCRPAWRDELSDITNIGKHRFGRIE